MKRKRKAAARPAPAPVVDPKFYTRPRVRRPGEQKPPDMILHLRAPLTVDRMLDAIATMLDGAAADALRVQDHERREAFEESATELRATARRLYPYT